jgi:hypothetical protein
MIGMSGQQTIAGPEQDFTMRHLQAELARLDLLLQRMIRHWRLAGQDPTDSFRGLYVADAEVDQLLARPLSSNWGQMATLPDEEGQRFDRAEIQLREQCQRWLEPGPDQEECSRLAQLVRTFGLSRPELDALLICLAPALDLRYERVYSYLQDDVTRKRPTINLVLDVVAPAALSRLALLAHFADSAPLFRYQLLERTSVEGGSLLNQILQVDETVVAWLLGHYQPQPDLGGQARLMERKAGPIAQSVDPLLVGQVELPALALPGSAPGATRPQPPLLVFSGPDRVSQRAAVRLMVDQLARSLLLVDLAAVIGADHPALRALNLALRDARLTGAVPALFGWDACLSPERTVAPELLAAICAFPDWLIIAGQSGWQAEGIERWRNMFWLEFPGPDYRQRLALWRHFLDLAPQPDEADAGADQDWNLPALAGQFVLTTGQIRDTIASARDMAAQRAKPLGGQELFLAARAHSNPRLATLARKIVPRFTWPDIILPPDQRAILKEIVATVRGRPVVLEQWGVGHKLASSAAVTVLFAGDPGTGKTMAAEVIANELGLDLYKIDLSTVISKYIGETEKNLEKIFSEAESSNAILFFDEADSIFGKRSEVKDAHDRYANIEVSYLLQRMEAYDGVTILATNLRANLDEAFTRRLQFAVDFPFPEKEDRLRIWQTLFPPDVPRAPDLNFGLLAQRFKLAGGNIRNIIVSAAYQAAADGGQVTMAHLLHGTRRELQKMGRLIGEEDLRI